MKENLIASFPYGKDTISISTVVLSDGEEQYLVKITFQNTTIRKVYKTLKNAIMCFEAWTRFLAQSEMRSEVESAIKMSIYYPKSKYLFK